MNHYILFYDYVPDYMERRVPLRGEHMAFAKGFLERGEMIIAGAFADPADGAALVFAGESRAVAERFAEGDPYVRDGLVTRWWVREWTTVVGRDAAHPVALPQD